MSYYRTILLGTLLSITSITWAQTHISQTLIWYGASIKKEFKEGQSLALKIERRDFISPARQQQLVIPDLVYSKKLKSNFKLDVGLWVFTIYQPELEGVPIGVKQHEWRPYVTVHYKKNLAKGDLDFYVMTEYRGFNAPTADNRFTEAFDTYALRERLLVRYNLPLCTNLKMRFAEELALNVATNRALKTFDHNRLMSDFIYTIPIKERKINLRAGYLHWYQPTAVADVFFSRHILTTGIDVVL